MVVQVPRKLSKMKRKNTTITNVSSTYFIYASICQSHWYPFAVIKKMRKKCKQQIESTVQIVHCEFQLRMSLLRWKSYKLVYRRKSVNIISLTQHKTRYIYEYWFCCLAILIKLKFTVYANLVASCAWLAYYYRVADCSATMRWECNWIF